MEFHEGSPLWIASVCAGAVIMREKVTLPLAALIFNPVVSLHGKLWRRYAYRAGRHYARAHRRFLKAIK